MLPRGVAAPLLPGKCVPRVKAWRAQPPGVAAHHPTPLCRPPPASLPPRRCPQFILGNTGFKTAAISHRPSNADLLLRSARSLSNLRTRSFSSLAGAVGGSGSGNHGSSENHGGSSSSSSSRLGPQGQAGPGGAAGDAVVAAVVAAAAEAQGSDGGSDKPA